MFITNNDTEYNTLDFTAYRLISSEAHPYGIEIHYMGGTKINKYFESESEMNDFIKELGHSYIELHGIFYNVIYITAYYTENVIGPEPSYNVIAHYQGGTKLIFKFDTEVDREAFLKILEKASISAEVVDNLESTDPDVALSANQGRILNEKIEAMPKFGFLFVDELPEVGQSDKIYLVPVANPDEKNVKEEWIYADGEWEMIGTTKLDILQDHVFYLINCYATYPTPEVEQKAKDVASKFITDLYADYQNNRDTSIVRLGIATWHNRSYTGTLYLTKTPVMNKTNSYVFTGAPIVYKYGSDRNNIAGIQKVRIDGSWSGNTFTATYVSVEGDSEFSGSFIDTNNNTYYMPSGNFYPAVKAYADLVGKYDLSSLNLIIGYSSYTTYHTGDLLLANKNNTPTLFRCIQDAYNKPLTNTSYWEELTYDYLEPYRYVEKSELDELVFEGTEAEWNELTPTEQNAYAIAVVDAFVDLTATDVSNINSVLGSDGPIESDLTETEAENLTNEIIGGE